MKHRNGAAACGLYSHPMVCEVCHKPQTHMGTWHDAEGTYHACWPCGTGTPAGSLSKTLHQLNAERKAAKENAR